MPRHVYQQWRRHFNLLIDAALAAEMKPWALAETFAYAIWREWAVVS